MSRRDMIGGGRGAAARAYLKTGKVPLRFVATVLAAGAFFAPRSAQAQPDVHTSPSVGERLPMGAACRNADECASSLCLAGFSEEPICTRACGGVLPACPALWSCEMASK